MPKTAGILLVGNEILSGKIVDANASYLCRELRGLGVEVRRITVIPDEVDLIAAEVSRFGADYDVVFTSGGVGPTHDDVTIEGVARAAGVSVIRHPALVALLQSYYKDALNEAHLKMAEVPDGAELLASSDRVAVQAFRAGERAWGIQFHQEVDGSEFGWWLELASAAMDLEAEWGKSVETLRREAAVHMHEHEERGRELFRRFADVVRESGT